MWNVQGGVKGKRKLVGGLQRPQRLYSRVIGALQEHVGLNLMLQLDCKTSYSLMSIPFLAHSSRAAQSQPRTQEAIIKFASVNPLLVHSSAGISGQRVCKLQIVCYQLVMLAQYTDFNS